MKQLAILLLLAAQAQAQDRAELEPTPIVGNRELPKVLYIVPWKAPQAGAPTARPPYGALAESLQPLDRAVFNRQLRYGQQLQQRQAAPSQSPTPAATGESR